MKYPLVLWYTLSNYTSDNASFNFFFENQLGSVYCVLRKRANKKYLNLLNFNTLKNKP